LLSEPQASPIPAEPNRLERAEGFALQPGEENLDSMTTQALALWENRDVSTVDRPSDLAEAIADEKQDVTTSLNFPLHWTSAVQSWNYLFDFSIACELLAPRPDDLVLDFAAGTCWATEILSRIGVRAVAMDLSIEMMRRGRQRLSADSRLVLRDARFIAARGQSLPFGTGTFDGVMCMNALHHVPSYADALREIHRVLKPGGRAVFSEPGTAHASQPLSQFRMREETIVEKNVSLPLVRRLAMQAGFSRMRVVPLRSSGAYAFDYSGSQADGGPLGEMWEDTRRCYPAEHARFVLHKGDDPPADTFLPAHQLGGRLRAVIVPDQEASVVGVGQPFTARVRVRNAGSVMWKARGRRFGGQVTLGVKVGTAIGEMVREDLGRTALPHDVGPGEDVLLDVTISGLPAGRYQLRYDMVVEGVIWFELDGSSPVRCELEVRAV
jgi:SAM-dependent methyltransferase